MTSDSTAITPSLQLVGEVELAQILQTTPMVRFEYNFNRPGSIVMMVFSVILLAGAVVLWVLTGLTQFGWFLLAALLVLSACGIWAYVYKWHSFAQTAFLALSTDHLYVGDLTQAWRVGWSLLDVQKLGFDRLNPSRYSSTLNIQLAGQDIELFLYNPLVHLGDLQGFMVEVLTQIQPEQLEHDDALLEEASEETSEETPEDRAAAPKEDQ